MSQRAQVRAFRRRYRIGTVNSAVLSQTLEQQGYTLVEFNGLSDSEEVTILIDALRVRDWVERSRCFTYRDEHCRVVFLHEDLNEEERTVVLAHEEGHIWNGHMTRDRVIGEDVLQEREANEFVHYLLRDPAGRKRSALRLGAAVVLLLAAVLCGLLLWKLRHDRAVYTDHLYRTPSGHKYHLRECVSIRERKDVRRLTRKEYESGEYEPCEICLPDEER